jgi:hypothetical protein
MGWDARKKGEQGGEIKIERLGTGLGLSEKG